MAVAGLGLSSGYLLATVILFPAPGTSAEALQLVPALQGLTLERAQARLDAADLVLERIDFVRHPVVPQGVVIGQSHLPGHTALPGGAVRIAVSSGPEIRPVPDVTRLRSERAAVVLGAGGFVVVADTVESGAPAGRIVGIEPPPGTELTLPDEVRLRVSQGPPTFPMPGLHGATEAEALALLDSLGLVLSGVERRLSLRNPGEVVDHAPGAGDPVELGAAVHLVVGEDPRGTRTGVPPPAASEETVLLGDRTG